MGITNGIDRLLRALRTAPLQGSLAGEPGQNAWPDAVVPASLASLDAEDAAPGGREATDNGLEAAEPEPAPAEPAGVPAGPEPSFTDAGVLDVASADGTGPATDSGTEGELVTAAEEATAAEATAAEAVEGPAGLDAHELARLEAASDLVESLGLGFHLGGAVERIVRGASEGKTGVKSLREASWLIERYIVLVEQRPVGADLHAASVRLNRAGEAIAGLRAISAALEAERVPGSALSAGGEPSAAELPGETELARPADPEPAPAADRDPPPASEVVTDQRSFGYEVALMAVRWTIMVVAVIAVVLAVTLIGDWG